MLGEKYTQMLIFLLVHSIILILIFFKTSGLVFKLELLLFLFLLFISLIYLFGLFFEEGWAWVLVMLFYAVNLLNILFLRTRVSDHVVLFGILLIVDFIAFFKAIANIGEEEEDLEIEPYESEEKKENQDIPEVEVYEEKKEAEKKTAKKKPAKKKSRKKAKKKSKK